MTTDLAVHALAVHAETLPSATSPHRPDPVRARVAANSTYALADAEWRRGSATAPRGNPLSSDSARPQQHSPHLGDILYWAACLGGACLLLFVATM
jgi:hypothetical protein